jgi:hypothetical protein
MTGRNTFFAPLLARARGWSTFDRCNPCRAALPTPRHHYTFNAAVVLDIRSAPPLRLHQQARHARLAMAHFDDSDAIL